MAELLTDRLSIVVGVTGHRDIAPDDEGPLRAAFGRILERLSSQSPNTPLLVLSGLAAGADSLAAEEALARNIPVFACLPMPVDEYEKDFSPQQLVRFRGLLAASARVTVTSPRREHGYVATGRFIAQYSHLLVAFWDGQTSRGAGGTADVISMRLTGQVQSGDVESIPYLPDIGPVEHVVTPRTSSPRPANPFTTKRLYPKWFGSAREVGAVFNGLFGSIDVYNVDLATTLAPAGDPPLLAIMERTDTAANRLQRHTHRFHVMLLICAFFVAAVQVIAHFPAVWKVSGLAIAFLVYWWARRHDYENRYQDYRAIAEGLRVQNAWYCAGLRHRLVDNAYLKMQEGDLQWIRMALRFFYLIFCEDREFADASHEHPVCQDWVRSQWRYYYRATRREMRRKQVLDRIALAALLAGIACTCVALGVLTSQGLERCALLGTACPPPAVLAHFRSFDLLENLLTVPVAMAIVLGAIFGSYAEKHSLVSNVRRYERMYRVFDRARRTLRRIARGQPGNPKEIIYELGRAALVEHADWLIMRRDRPMKVELV